MEWENSLTGHANGRKLGRKNHSTQQERLRIQNDLDRFAKWSGKNTGREYEIHEGQVQGTT